MHTKSIELFIYKKEYFILFFIGISLILLIIGKRESAMKHLFTLFLLCLVFVSSNCMNASAAAWPVQTPELRLLELSHGQDQEAILSLLSSYTINLDTRDETGRTALELNVINNNTQVVEKLITQKACVNCRDRFGRTPLMWAAIHGNQESAKILIQADANWQLEDYKKRTALRLAAEQEHSALVLMLLEIKKGQKTRAATE